MTGTAVFWFRLLSYLFLHTLASVVFHLPVLFLSDSYSTYYFCICNKPVSLSVSYGISLFIWQCFDMEIFAELSPV